MPETKLATTREDNKRTLNYISLEELNQIFQVRTHECIRYYVRHVAWGRVNNALCWIGLRGRDRWVRIDDSMHFWVMDGLRRGKKSEVEVEEKEEGTQTANGDGGGDGDPDGDIQGVFGASRGDGGRGDQEKDQGVEGAHAEHVEHLSEGSSVVSSRDAGSRVSGRASLLPEVADTGGRLDFEAGRERGSG